jgi:hypothetical protein
MSTFPNDEKPFIRISANFEADSKGIKMGFTIESLWVSLKALIRRMLFGAQQETNSGENKRIQ